LNELTDVGGGAGCGIGSFWTEGCDDAYPVIISRYVNDKIASTYVIYNWFYWNFVFP